MLVCRRFILTLKILEGKMLKIAGTHREDSSNRPTEEGERTILDE